MEVPIYILPRKLILPFPSFPYRLSKNIYPWVQGRHWLIPVTSGSAHRTRCEEALRSSPPGGRWTGREQSTPWPGTGTTGKYRGSTGPSTIRLCAMPARISTAKYPHSIAIHEINTTLSKYYICIVSVIKISLQTRKIMNIKGKHPHRILCMYLFEFLFEPSVFAIKQCVTITAASDFKS